MIWLAWRQFRVQALIAFAFLLAVAIAFFLTGPNVLHTYHTTIVGCAARRDCQGAQNSFLSTYPFLQNLLTESEFLAVVIGIFWGAPVVAREFDTGTFRLAWTQSASRAQWLRAKMLVGGIATIITAGLFTLMATWWSSPIDRVRDQPFSLFDTRDIVPIGYALFAFALGVAIGALVRRVIPAMVLTIAAFAAVRGLFNFVIRQHFAPALRATFSYASSSGGGFRIGGNVNPGDWILTSVVKSAAGKVFPRLNGGLDFQPDGNGVVTFVGAGRCPKKIPGFPGVGGRSGPAKAVQEALGKCVDSFHLHEIVSYQPTSRYWSFQWYELSSYVVLSLILAAFSVWWIRRP
jgi:ABC-type transport system involved in multi-copper enzyme maturation permease subunit